MKKIRSVVLKIAIMLLVIFSLIIAANAGYSKVQHEQELNISRNGDRSEFYAEISFYTYEGEGCGCQPVRNAPIFAQGLDTDHSASNTTDDDGLCVLELEYDATYRVTIEVDAFQMVLFDFVVIDDQTFTFHLQEEEESSTPNVFSLHNLLQKLSHIKNL